MSESQTPLASGNMKRLGSIQFPKFEKAPKLYFDINGIIVKDSECIVVTMHAPTLFGCQYRCRDCHGHLIASASKRGNVGEIRLAHSVLPFPLVVLVTIPPVRL